LAYLISSFSLAGPLHIITMIITKLAKMSKKTEDISTTAAAILICNSGVASEKMKMAIMRAE